MIKYVENNAIKQPPGTLGTHFWTQKSPKSDYFHPKMAKNHIKKQKRFLYSVFTVPIVYTNVILSYV